MWDEVFGCWFFFFQAEDGIRDIGVTGVQTCALPISWRKSLFGASAISFAIASGADRPCSKRSRPFGPRRGSVTFWVETAPTPTRTQGQRAEAAIDEVVIATPSMPVREQRPAIEKVICASSVLLLLSAPFYP